MSIRDIFSSKSVTGTFHQFAPAQVKGRTVDNAGVPARSAYINIWIRGARIPDLRKGTRKFYGAVHSLVATLPAESITKAEVACVIAPRTFAKMDPSHLDRVISINYCAYGPIAHSGNPIEMDLALFSVKQADLAAPYLQMLQSLSGIAGVGVLQAALPLAGPIVNGLNAILGSDDTVLETGISQMLGDPIRTGVYMVTAAPKETFDATNLVVDAADWTVSIAGKAFEDHAYIVFEVEAVAQKFDYYRIPSVAAQHVLVMDAIRNGNLQQAEAALVTFRRVAITCPELIPQDARGLVAKVEEQIKEAFGTVQTHAKLLTRGPVIPKTLEELRLYEK
jgi:hypothetical protein